MQKRPELRRCIECRRHGHMVGHVFRCPCGSKIAMSEERQRLADEADNLAFSMAFWPSLDD